MNQEDKSPLPQQETVPGKRRSRGGKGKRSVIHYLTILFGAAFVLLLMTYMMERRQNQSVIDGLNQSISGLKQSVSAMQSAQDLYDQNTALLEQVSELEDRLGRLEGEHTQLQQELLAAEDAVAQLQNAQKAMDWFWQVDEAFVRGRNGTARSLIRQMEELELPQYLPKESVTDNGRFSPAARYQEIWDILF